MLRYAHINKKYAKTHRYNHGWKSPVGKKQGITNYDGA